jgi:PAS domain S-box-containing protein
MGSSELRFDIARDLVCTADAEGRFKSLNAAWERVLGWKREELQSKRFIEFVHPDDVERTTREAAKIDRRDFELVDFENRYRTKAGDYRWLRWSARSDGETWFAVAFDISEQKEAEARLRTALAEDRMLAYSQPIVDQRTRRVVQEELLVRLRANEGDRVLRPAEFLPDAERLGLIAIIDAWMAERAVELAARGRNVELNVSPKSIGDESFVAELAGMMRTAGVSARRVIIEITETAALEELEAAKDFAERLTGLGCRFALDDFGTGFGFLSHVRQLQIHLLKIDITFVGGMRTSERDRALVRGVTAIAKELGLETVAEGVEDAVTYRLLGDYGVDRAQGYLIGHPTPVDPDFVPRPDRAPVNGGGPRG